LLRGGVVGFLFSVFGFGFALRLPKRRDRLTIVILIVIPEKRVFFITIFTTNFAIVTLSKPVLTKEVSKCTDKGSIEVY
jgi:hypothetical protein